MKKSSIFIFLLSLCFISCLAPKIPSAKFAQYQIEISAQFASDSLLIRLENTLKSPLRVKLSSTDKALQQKFEEVGTISIHQQSDTTLTFLNTPKINGKISYASQLGSLSKEIKSIPLALPFPSHKSHTVIQGNNSNFTHNTDYSRYAVDFNLKTNDTICASTDGFVVGVIDQYKYGGNSPKWRDYANFITIYEPNSGIYTQYVHLVHKGSLVQVGDQVSQGQPIGLSGNTGFSSGEHLHFSCLIPADTKEGFKSIPFQFENGIKSTDLKRGQQLQHP